MKAFSRSLPEALGCTVRLALRPTNRAATIRPRPISRPGMTPALNRSVMEASAMEPYTTKVMDGGITTPMAPPAAIRAQAKAGE